MGAENIATFSSFLFLGNCQQQFFYSENCHKCVSAHLKERLIFYVNIFWSWKTFFFKRKQLHTAVSIWEKNDNRSHLGI